VLIDGCLCLRAGAHHAPVNAPNLQGRSDIEWDLNEIMLDGPRDPSDPSWRPQLLGWGLHIARALLTQAVELCGDSRAQALICLQSTAGPEDPEHDSGIGSLFFYRVRDRAIDGWAIRRHDDWDLEYYSQPLLLLSHGRSTSIE
jgi:hypothetical protein